MAKVELQVVKDRMIALGIDLEVTDDVLINFSIDKVTNFIKNETNQGAIPDGAYEVAIDMVIADFLLIKYATGTLDIPSINFDVQSVKSIKDGDTTVDYGSGDSGSANNPTAKFLTWLNELMHKDQDWGIWRRFRW